MLQITSTSDSSKCMSFCTRKICFAYCQSSKNVKLERFCHEIEKGRTPSHQNLNQRGGGRRRGEEEGREEEGGGGHYRRGGGRRVVEFQGNDPQRPKVQDSPSLTHTHSLSGTHTHTHAHTRTRTHAPG